MTRLDISSNNLTGGKWTNASGDNDRDDSSNYETNMAGVIALANAIPDMGAISSVNLLFNDIGTEKAQALVNILKEHPALKSLCGNKGNETELDMSGKPGKRMGAEGAIMLVPEIIDNGAMTSLNLAANCLCGINEYGGGVYDTSGAA